MAVSPVITEWAAEMAEERRKQVVAKAPDLIVVHSYIEPQAGTFTCVVDGWFLQLTPAEILAAAKRGTNVEEASHE